MDTLSQAGEIQLVQIQRTSSGANGEGGGIPQPWYGWTTIPVVELAPIAIRFAAVGIGGLSSIQIGFHPLAGAKWIISTVSPTVCLGLSPK